MSKTSQNRKSNRRLIADGIKEMTVRGDKLKRAKSRKDNVYGRKVWL